MYEKYAKLRDLRKVKDAQVAAATGIPRSTFTDWKNKRSQPGPAKIEKIARFFSVPIDFLMGNTEDIICPICRQHYRPLDEKESEKHDDYHNRFLAAEEKYGTLMPYMDADHGRDDAIRRFRNKRLSNAERIDAFDEYLRCEFTREIYKSGFGLYLDFDDFANNEIDGLRPDIEVSSGLINMVREKYGMPKIVEPSSGGYYLNDETAEIAQDILENKELRMLFSVGRNMAPEDLRALHGMALALKRREDSGDDPA